MLAGLAGCLACHTEEGGAPGAGGYALPTQWGTFHGPNITPDPEHGLGAWTFEDFERAMRHGRDPDGRFLYPAFPYPSYTGISDDDLRHLWAWLQFLDPVAQPDTPHDLNPGARARSVLGLWRMVGFRRGPFEPARGEDPVLARGRYLGEAVAHCGGCHTPRSGIGVPRRGAELAGTDAPPEPSPDIRPHPAGDPHAWSHDDRVTLLAYGMTPEGDFVGGEMMRLVEEGTRRLSDADREALARWWHSVPPRPASSADDR